MPTPTLVPTLVDSFPPGWARTGTPDNTGVARIDATHSVAWWHENIVGNYQVNLNVVGYTNPASPTFGPVAATTPAFPGRSIGGVRPVPGSQLLLVEGPASEKINCFTWNTGSLALTIHAVHGLPTTDPNDSTRTMSLPTVIPLSSTRAFVFMESIRVSDPVPRMRHLVWLLVALTSTGIGATIAFGSFAVDTAAGVVLQAFRVDATRVLLVLNDTAGSARVIQDTGTGATVGAALTGFGPFRPVGSGDDGTFYSLSATAGALRRLTISGTTITPTVLVGSTDQPVAVIPFDASHLLSLTTGVGAAVVDRTDGKMGPAGTGVPFPNEARWVHRTVAHAASQLAWVATYDGPVNATFPMLHLIGHYVPSVGGWGVGMVRMGGN